jgi:hypothetical protein
VTHVPDEFFTHRRYKVELATLDQIKVGLGLLVIVPVGEIRVAAPRGVVFTVKTRALHGPLPLLFWVWIYQVYDPPLAREILGVTEQLLVPQTLVAKYIF